MLDAGTYIVIPQGLVMGWRGWTADGNVVHKCGIHEKHTILSGNPWKLLILIYALGDAPLRDPSVFEGPDFKAR